MSKADLKQLESTECQQLCKSLQPEQPHEMQGLQSLSYLRMDGSLLVNNVQILLGSLPALQILEIFGCSHLIYLSEEEEMCLQLQQLTSLQELQFSNCECLKHLPNNLVILSSLKKLTIDYCLRSCHCQRMSCLPHSKNCISQDACC